MKPSTCLSMDNGRGLVAVIDRFSYLSDPDSALASLENLNTIIRLHSRLSLLKQSSTNVIKMQILFLKSLPTGRDKK